MLSGTRLRFPSETPASKLFLCPPDSNLRCFLSVAPNLICLWNAGPVHLLSYVSRPEAFVEITGGGYVALEAWIDKKIFLRLGSGDSECFELHDCPKQLPFGSKESSWFLVHARFEAPPSHALLSCRLEGAVDGSELALHRYYHSYLSSWLSFEPELRIPSDCSCFDFSGEYQLLAFGHEGKLEVHSVHGDKDELLWSIACEATAIQWCHGNLWVLSSGHLTVYSVSGAIFHEIETPAVDFVVLVDRLVLSMKESLEVLPISLPCAQISTGSLGLDFSASDSVNLFRAPFHADRHLQWETVTVPANQSCLVSSEEWVCCLDGRDIFLMKRSTRLWKQVRSTHSFAKALFIGESHLLLLTEKQDSVRLVDPEDPRLHSLCTIDLGRACSSVHCSLVNGIPHIFSIFLPEPTVHVYRIDTDPAGLMTASFSLNLALGSQHSHTAHWQVAMLQNPTLASPSETDIRDAARVNIETLVFLQGDSLFTVTLRPSSAGDTVMATGLDRAVDRFHIIRVQSDAWLLAVKKDHVALRRWPFDPKPDLCVPLNFYPSGFYPDLAGSGPALWSLDDFNLGESLLLGPHLFLYLLGRGGSDAISLLPRNQEGSLTIFLEYVLLELMKAERHVARQLLIQLQRLVPHTIARRPYARALIRLARKSEPEEAHWLFANSTSAESLFSELISARDCQLACELLVLRLTSTPSGSDDALRAPVLKLVEVALATGDFAVVTDVRRFVSTIWSPSDTSLIVTGETCI